MKLTKMRSKFFQYHIFLLLFITSGKVIAESSLEAKLKMQRDNQAYTPLQFVQPRYPSKAQRKGTEGYAIVSFTITKKGTTEDPVGVYRKS
jgi:protein TonB